MENLVMWYKFTRLLFAVNAMLNLSTATVTISRPAGTSSQHRKCSHESNLHEFSIRRKTGTTRKK